MLYIVKYNIMDLFMFILRVNENDLQRIKNEILTFIPTTVEPV
jgi:hypothetical protein